MAFIENHDTDRFLGDGTDTLSLKQALSLLLTIKRIPQLYYGTEVLMNGTKQVTDGNVRKDFPGGFPGDTHNAFTAEGRTKAENDMFNFVSRLLHWRQGNDVIVKGTQTQFIPYKGVYVIARQYEGKTVLTILNGTNESSSFFVARYAEVIGDASAATDVTTRRSYSLKQDISLSPRESLVLQF
jgi:glycosidase